MAEKKEPDKKTTKAKAVTKARVAKARKKKRKKKLATEQEAVDDFLLGMAQDAEVADPVMSMGDPHFDKAVQGYVSTQACTLDCAIGRPGIPLSRLTMLHGKEGGGKTTVALQAIAEVQQRGGLALYIDKEHKLDKKYAVKLGVNLSRLIYPKKLPTLERVIAIIKAAIRRAEEIKQKTKRVVPLLIVVDSLNACKAFETVETDTGKKRYPAEARIWSEELPAMVEDISELPVGLVFVSQVRKKMNVMFGSDEELAGGNAPRFYASLIIYIQRVGVQKDSSGEKTGSIIEAECKKNQISPPFKKAKFIIFYARGIDYEHSLLLQCEAFGWLKKKKGKFKIGKTVLDTNRINSADVLRARPKVRDKLKALVAKKMEWDDAA